MGSQPVVTGQDDPTETFVNTLTTKTILASSLAVALTACGGEPQQPEPTPTATPTPVAEYDPASRDYTLAPEAQALRDEADMAAFREEYMGYRQENETAATADGDAADAATQADTDPRAGLSWADLDRNDDAHLTPGEYAIWAATVEQGNAELTDEQEKRIVDSFYYYDQNRDGELSQREFTSARRGDDLG